MKIILSESVFTWLKPGENEKLCIAQRLLLTLFLLCGFCLLTSVFSQTQPTPSASPTPTPSPSPSPTPPPNLHQWGAVTSFHGLPSDRTHAIAQTAGGVTWFATDGGLARYDGRRISAINDEGLPPGRVLALKTDESGTLWIGTENGAARLWNGRFQSIKETSGSVITAIITPQKDRALLASENGRIFDCRPQTAAAAASANQTKEEVDSGSLVVKPVPQQPLLSSDKDHPGNLKITSLAMAGDKLYAGTQSRGILAIENGEAIEINNKPRSYFINALETDAQGHLWAGARGGKDESEVFDDTDPQKPVRANSSTGSVNTIVRGAHEDIWVGSDGHGAFHFENGKPIEHFTFEGTGGALRSDHVFGIFVDAEEVVWFATDKGVCRYDPHAIRAEPVGQESNANYVRSLFSGGRLLAGTNSGLFVYQSEKKTWQPLPDIGRRIIYAIADTPRGALVATSSGLFAARGSPRADLGAAAGFVRIPAGAGDLPQGDSVRAIANAGGSIYIATYGYGVERVQGLQRTLVWPDSSADNEMREITALGTDGTDRLLIGTASAGIFLFDGKEPSTLNALQTLKGDPVWSLVSEGANLWIGSGRGLYLFASGELKEIVPNVNARSIALSSDNLRSGQVWCATVANGLLRISLDDQFGAIVSRMDVEQGLPSQRVFAVLSSRNSDGAESIIAGTNRGIVRYDPGRVAPAVTAARITGQRIHQPQELAAGLVLAYPQNSLLLDVTAISSRTFPEQFQYAFALYDSAGKIIQGKLSHDSQFAMEKLKPGKYKVVARAFTKDLTPATPLSFELTIARAPFPWTSTALAILLLLALIALAWGYLQNRRIHRASAELAAANRELADARFQLANETEAERRRIARDLHDQTLADLRNLALLVDRLPAATPGVRPNRAPSAPGALRHEIEAISQEVRRICEDLSPSALENVGLSAALQFALAHAVEHAAPDCKFDYEFICDDALDEKLNLPSSTQIQIYRIVQEALSNISRHANAKHVKMTAAINDGFELKIEDDGRGFDASEKTTGRGLVNIRARASMIHSDVEWHRRDGGGTEFRLKKS